MILITGAGGFVGRSVTHQLTLAQQEWLAYNGRIHNPYQLRTALKGIHTVIHLASSEVRGRNRLLRLVDVAGTQRLVEESRRAGVQRLIYVSRIGADPNAAHPLLRAKGEIERVIIGSDIPYTIIRSASLYGRGDRFTEIVLSLGLWSWPLVWLPGGGDLPLQPLWVEDLARCLVAALNRPDLLNKTVTVAGDERYSYRSMVLTLLQERGVDRLPLSMPLVLLRPFTTILFSWWYWPPVTRYFVDRFFVPELADLDSMVRQFGFRPARLADNAAYLHRPGLRWRLFRR